MQLKWLNVADLIAQAGGDPWEINRSLSPPCARQAVSSCL